MSGTHDSIVRGRARRILESGFLLHVAVAYLMGYASCFFAGCEVYVPLIMNPIGCYHWLQTSLPSGPRPFQQGQGYIMPW